jgi:hypothetical protein
MVLQDGRLVSTILCNGDFENTLDIGLVRAGGVRSGD